VHSTTSIFRHVMKRADDGYELLREYTRQVLLEDDGGGYGDLYYSDAMVGPWGLHFGSKSDMYNIFVKPFADVIGVATGKAKELSQKAQTAAKVAFETVATSLIPILRDEYKEIFEKEKEEIDKIKEEYADVYGATAELLRNNDMCVVAFMMAPQAFLSAKIIQKSPKAAIKAISVLTGGTIDTWLEEIKEKYGLNKEEKPQKTRGDIGYGFGGGGGMGGGGGYGGDYGGAFGGDIGFEHVIREAKLPPIEQVLSDPRVIAKVTQSSKARRMQQTSEKAIASTLANVAKLASAVLSAQSLQDLQQKSGVKLKGLDKLAQVPPQEKQQAEKQLLDVTKKSMKEFFCKNLEAQAKQAVDAGVPSSSPFVQQYQQAVSKIKSM